MKNKWFYIWLVAYCVSWAFLSFILWNTFGWLSPILAGIIVVAVRVFIALFLVSPYGFKNHATPNKGQENKDKRKDTT